MAMKLLIPLGKSKLLWSGAKFDLTKFGCGRMLEGWEARALPGSFWKSCQPTHWHIPGCVKRLIVHGLRKIKGKVFRQRNIMELWW